MSEDRERQDPTGPQDETTALPPGPPGDGPRQASPNTGDPELTEDGRPDTGPVAHQPALKRWGRYEILGLLGSGGMGKVYKAFDADLGRPVALKLLHAGGGDVDRFLQEARAQARVDHPNVCKVYEAGTLEGEPYIAMQFVPGRTLAQAGQAMSLEQRIGVMRLVAEGLHAAHRQGLIHRDMKPSNIMVEEDEAGRWVPYIMDFGLAHLEDSGQTVAGTVLGTPAYMAPEQARGDTAHTDRRTDVYGLGATLYQVLSGHPPFEADSLAGVIFKVIHDEPAPPRQYAPSVPLDLETIALKCLEKDPQRRYDSARALAEDLGRYLDGEPVLARPAGAFYRLGKRARKHKVAAASLLLAVLVAVGATGLLVRQSWLAAQRERLASRFGEVGWDMEAIMERSRLLPLHDVTYARTLVERKMGALRAEMAGGGAVALGPGHYALGRGYLALGDYGSARRELETAWNAHRVRDKGAAYTLGLTLVELYRAELAAAQRLQNPGARRERMALIDAGLRQPALKYLTAGREAGASPEYAQALLAFLDRNYEKTIEHARSAEERSSWLYSASILSGDAWVEIGNDRRNRGQGEGARQAYAEAERSYQAAAKKGGSDPRCYEGLAQLRLDEMYMELVQTGRPLKAAFESARTACQQALTADPRRALAYSLLSTALFRWGQDLASRGEDAAPTYTKAIAAAERAVALDPSDERTFKSLGDSCYLFALYEYDYNRPAAPLLEKAVKAYGAAIGLNPRNPALHSNLGNAYDILAVFSGSGTSAALDEVRKKGEASFREAVRLAPKESDYWNNLGASLLRQGQDRVERSEDPEPLFGEAVASLEEALRLNPENTSAYNNLGFTYELLGEYELDQKGTDPRAPLDKAELAFRQFLRRNPDSGIAWRNLGNTLLSRAKYEAAAGPPTSATLDRARQSYRKALRVNAEDPESWLSLANANLLDAQTRLDRGQDAQSPLREAEGPYHRAEALAGEFYALLDFRSRLALLRGRAAIASGHSPEGAFGNAEAAAEKAIAKDPQLPSAYLNKVEIYARWAAWLLSKRPAEARPLVQRGVETARKVLTLSPGHPRAQALLASLLEMQSRLERDPARRDALQREARANLTQALERAPLLDKEFQTLKRALGVP